jgi:hypothetical protein
MYHTQIQNIQILLKPLFLKIQGIIKTMTNQPEPQYESLAMKIFSDFCCNGCSCKSESDHNK